MVAATSLMGAPQWPMAHELTFDDDRLFPLMGPPGRSLDRIYAETCDLPIISPHGHVPSAWLADNTSFENSTRLLITPTITSTRSCTPTA